MTPLQPRSLVRRRPTQNPCRHAWKQGRICQRQFHSWGGSFAIIESVGSVREERRENTQMQEPPGASKPNLTGALLERMKKCFFEGLLGRAYLGMPPIFRVQSEVHKC